MQKETKEDDYFISKRELGKLFDSSFPLEVNLWRGQKPSEKGAHVLYPILKSYLLSNGKIREPDIDTYQKGGVIWIKANGGGVSLFDVLGVPNKNWSYYRLPAGTPIPMGLVILKDSFNPRHNATHYTICPNWDMPLKNFLMLLDQLIPMLVAEN